MNAAAATAETWPHATVLVVDDEPGMRNFLAKTLQPRTGGVMTASSAEEAAELLQRHRFDLLILDITLPGKNGITLLQELRAAGNPCEVVLITAFADLDTAIEALRAGAGDFLLKPFRVAQLLGASRQRVNQELKSMERDGAIRVEQGGLVVRDRAALMNIIDADN